MKSPNPDNLLEVAEAVIRAEWEFRCGSRSYKLDTQAWFEDSMYRLREVVTGEPDLGAAGIVLGKSGDVSKQPKPKIITRLRMPNNARIQPNLFED